MVVDHGTTVNMREIAISRFKATCLAVLEEVRRTGAPVSVTRFGRPVAEIVPPKNPQKGSWLGCMKDSMEVVDDIEGPIGAFRRWTADQK
jgi:prevent-host-death family protein